jgi:hypothetical protein
VSAARALALVLLVGALLAPGAVGAAEDGARLLDGFDDASAWKAMPADGVEMRLSSEAGALRVDFRFVKGGGYAVLHRSLDLELPENYRFTFRIRGECPSENLEFKLLDSTGANVWWRNQRDFAFPREWETTAIRKRQIGFAWGPAGGGDARHVAAIEFAITAGSGGSGTVWLDDLTLAPLPAPTATPPALAAHASSALPGHGPELAVDGDPRTSWVSDADDRLPWLELDLGTEREFGGLVVDWTRDGHTDEYVVEVSADRAAWSAVRTVSGWGRPHDYLDLPETEARYVRLRTLSKGVERRVGLREVTVMPLEWAATPEAFFRAIAREAPRGSYPRAITGEQSFWTVVGVDGGREKGLLNQDGMLETGRGSFSIEPFLLEGGRLVSWADVTPEASLEDGVLPIPSVHWQRDDLALGVTAFADGGAGASSLVARYRVRNLGTEPVRATLFLALRPFQVNPPEQFLGIPGGTARLRSLDADGQVVRVNGDRGLVSLTAPTAFGAASFDEGDIVADFLRQGRLPPRTQVTDPRARASGALAYRLDLDPGAEEEVDLLVPLGQRPVAPPERTDASWRTEVEARLASCRDAWRERVGRVSLRLPGPAAEVTRALQAQLGWILVNRDSAAIQPGSRSYARSWIRDGALTSSALLRLGHPEVVRQFIEWYAPHLYADGKVPCCVDARGSDPVPENDSNGEFIYLVAEYVRTTGDRALAERMWPAVARAAAYLDTLRAQRRTAEWRAPGKEEYFGLLPPSISHEGYSAKPMHSYWDDLFALRGFKDAAWLAGELGLEADRERLAASRDEFQRDLVASIAATMKVHGIDYVPGCAELGDFDATSTTIALNPVQADDVLPRAALEQTFQRYWDFFRERRDGVKPWEAFTPYEMRTIGAFVRLGWPERAQELLEFFLRYRRPAGWNQWAEVVWHDEKTPHFIGDLPHTWVGSDFVRSVLDLFAYERERDSALVIGAGLPRAWLADSGVVVRGLRTRWGPFSYSLRGDEGEVTLTVEDTGLRVPPGGIVVAAPIGTFGGAEVTRSIAAEDPSTISQTEPVIIRKLPATVRWSSGHIQFKSPYR